VTATGPRALRVLPALVYGVLILYGGVIDVGPLPQTPGVPTDKVLHAGAFLLFEWLMELALLELEPRFRRLLAVVSAVALGFGLEAVQAALPHRSAEWLDFLADAVGAVMGALLLALLGKLRSTRVGSRNANYSG